MTSPDLRGPENPSASSHLGGEDRRRIELVCEHTLDVDALVGRAAALGIEGIDGLCRRQRRMPVRAVYLPCRWSALRAPVHRSRRAAVVQARCSAHIVCARRAAASADRNGTSSASGATHGAARKRSE